MNLPNALCFKAYLDCVVSSSLIYAEWREYTERMFVRKSLDRDGVIIDVGANVGDVSLLLADLVGPQNIFAFEPTPLTFRRLAENWKINVWPADNLFQIALGAQRGTTFVQDVDRPVTTNAVTANPEGGKSVEVPLERLDKYGHLWEHKKVAFLKIDVEGFELNVFKGSEVLLREKRPRLIMFEPLPKGIDGEIAAFLAARDYEVFQLDSMGKPDFAGKSAQNLFAAPRESCREFI